MSTKPLRSVLISCLLLVIFAATLQRASASNDAFISVAAPKLWVTPLILDFGPVGVGVTSEKQSVIITNVGTATLTNFAGGGVTSPFYATQNCAGGVAPGESCQYFFTFSPMAVGSFTDFSDSSTNAGQFSIELRGTGVGAGLHVNPLSLDFGSVYKDNTSTTQVVTITNTGQSVLTNFAGGGVTSPFHATQNCAGGVAPGESCQYFFTFSPTGAGSFMDTSDSTTNAGPFSVVLKGRGRTIPFASGQRVTPLSIDFGPVGIGINSGTYIVTLTNQELFDSITQFAGGGVNPPFYGSQTCAGGVGPGESCEFRFYFLPTSEGTFAASSSVSDSEGSFTVQLRGTGVGAKLHVTPLALDFGTVPLYTTSLSQSVTIRNTGLSTLAGFAGGGVYAPFSGSQSCAGGVAPGASCTYNFRFSPTSIGRYSATSSSGTNAGPIEIQLFGGEKLKIYLPLVTRQ